MLTNDVLIDAFERVKQEVHAAVKGLNVEQLTFRPEKDANSISWIVWHLTRVQDDHIADVANTEQLWTADKWMERFGLPFESEATGWSQTSDEVAQVKAGADLLLGYYDAVHEATIKYVSTLKPEDYERVVDANWDPPVTLAVRLVSVISDDLQHAGQAGYIRGLVA